MRRLPRPPLLSLQFLDRLDDAPPCRRAGHGALLKHGVRPHGGFEPRVLALGQAARRPRSAKLLVDQEVGGQPVSLSLPGKAQLVVSSAQ